MLANIRVALLLIIILVFANSENLGHRLGGDIYKPENTLFSYKKALNQLQKKKSFSYVEFDIRESIDGEIIVFHDSKIKRIVPQTKYNLEVLKFILKEKKFSTLCIEDLTAKEISKLKLEYNTHIPTLEEVLKASVKWKLKKPMRIEVKFLHSDKARYALVKSLSKYKEKLDISLIAFRKNFYESFPFSPRWIKLFQENDLNFYQIDKYEFTESNNMNLSQKVRFLTLLPETNFFIKRAKKRVKVFSFFLPKLLHSKDSIKIGIYGGADNSGDRGVTFRVLNEKGELLYSGFSKALKWEWFNIHTLNGEELRLIIEDFDTTLKGKKAGNRGMVKVLFARFI